MYREKWKESFWLEHIIVLMAGAFIFFGILYRTGAITSGFHMLDDHELIRYKIAFTENHASLAETVKSSIINDLRWRYRPLYWIERVTGSKLLGDNLTYWNYYTAIKGILTFYFLYYIARYLKYNRIISFLFVGIVLLGQQFTPWFRSANQESTGLLFGALTLYLIARQYYYAKYNNLLYNIAIVFGAILCGLVKESFTLFMPVFVALKLWLQYCEKGEFIRCIRENIVVYAAIVLSMLINVGMVVFYVGTDQVSYAGFHEGISLADYWSGMIYSLKFNLTGYTIAAGIILFAVAMSASEISKELRGKYLGFTAIGVYVLVVQLIVHAKSLMWERYIIPWIVGYSFLFVLLGYRIFEQNRWRRTLYTGVLVLLLWTEAPKAYQMSKDYAYTGQVLRLFFQDILDNTEDDSQIVCAFSAGELNLATECWMEAHERTQIYTYDIDTGEFKNETQLRGTAPESYSWEQAKVVVCYQDQVDDILQLMGISDESQCQINEYGGNCVITVL